MRPNGEKISSMYAIYLPMTMNLLDFVLASQCMRPNGEKISSMSQCSREQGFNLKDSYFFKSSNTTNENMFYAFGTTCQILAKKIFAKYFRKKDAIQL